MTVFYLDIFNESIYVTWYGQPQNDPADSALRRPLIQFNLAPFNSMQTLCKDGDGSEIQLESFNAHGEKGH